MRFIEALNFLIVNGPLPQIFGAVEYGCDAKMILGACLPHAGRTVCFLRVRVFSFGFG